MERYGNASGESGVRAYAIHAQAIDIEFAEGHVYRYSGVAPGLRHVRAMQRLARSGKGLATYINRQVRGNYETRLR